MVERIENPKDKREDSRRKTNDFDPPGPDLIGDHYFQA